MHANLTEGGAPQQAERFAESNELLHKALKGFSDYLNRLTKMDGADSTVKTMKDLFAKHNISESMLNEIENYDTQWNPDRVSLWNKIKMSPSRVGAWVDKLKENGKDNVFALEGSWMVKIMRVSGLGMAVNSLGSGVSKLYNAMTIDQESLDKAKIKRQSLVFAGVTDIALGCAIGGISVFAGNDKKMAQKHGGGMYFM
jgi:hypothetical protein